MPTGNWREQITHQDGSNGNSGLTRDAPVLDIGVAYTNLRFLFDGYRGRIFVGSGHYTTEDWPIIKHDTGLEIFGWDYVNFGDADYYGVRVERPDTGASNGQAFTRPLTLAELAIDREIREHDFRLRNMGFDGNMGGTPVFLDTPAPIVQLSHGGRGCFIESGYNRINQGSVFCQALYDGIEVELQHADHGGMGFFEALQDADPFSGVLNDPCSVFINGNQNDNTATPSDPLWVVRLVGKSTSKSKIFTFLGMTTESQERVVRHEPGPLGTDIGWKILGIGQGGWMGSSISRRVCEELAGTGEGAFWHLMGNATGGANLEDDYLYYSDKEGSPMTYGELAGEQPREAGKFQMAPGWAAPKVEVKA